MELEVLRLTHACSSLIGVLFLSYIWYCYYYRQQDKVPISKMDLGLPLLALAYFFWSILKFFEYIYCDGPCTDVKANVVHSLSCVNNALFLSSFSYFKHGFQIISKLKHRNRWILMVVIFSVPISIICLFAPVEVAKLIDLFFSSGTLLFMGLLLALAFHNRELSGLAVLALLVVVLEIIAQVLTTLGIMDLGIEKFKIWKYVVYLVAHSLLLANFIALAFTWIIEDEGVLEKFDLHAKTQSLVNEGIQDNIRPFVDLQYRLISEHADLGAVCRNLEIYFRQLNQNDNVAQIVQLQFRLSHSQKIWNMGHIDSKEFTRTRLEVSSILLDFLDEIRRNQQA